MQPIIHTLAICSQSGSTLQTLKVSSALKGCIKSIVDNCVQLRELNLVNSIFSTEEISYMVENLTSKVEKLSLDDIDKFNDDHLNTLVMRCKKLKLLDLRRTDITKISLSYIVKHLELLEEHLELSEIKNLH